MQRYSITKALNLPEYKITAILSETKEEIHIRVEPYKRKKATCGRCGVEHDISRHSQQEVIVQDKPISDLRVYLHVIKRFYKCPVDGRIYVEKVDWLKKWSRVTKRFAKQVNRLTAITTNQEAGWYLGLDDETVYRIDKETLEEQYKTKIIPPPAAINISVDEVSYKKYHKYLTNSSRH